MEIIYNIKGNICKKIHIAKDFVHITYLNNFYKTISNQKEVDYYHNCARYSKHLFIDSIKYNIVTVELIPVNTNA